MSYSRTFLFRGQDSIPQSNFPSNFYIMSDFHLEISVVWNRSQVFIFFHLYLYLSYQSSISFWKDCHFPKVFLVQTLSEIKRLYVYKSEDIFWTPYFVSYLSNLLPIPNCLINFYSFIISIDIQQSTYSQFVVLNCFAVICPLHSHIGLESPFWLKGISTGLLMSL